MSRNIEFETVLNYYNSLSNDEKKTAFTQMVQELIMCETLCYSDETNEIYWDSCGIKLGENYE